MAEETVAQFLGRRERELSAQVAALKGQLAPKEAELEQVRKMRALLPGGALDSMTDAIDSSLGRSSANIADLADAPYAPSTSDPYSDKTIKELVIQALLDNFPNGGTAATIRDFIRDAYRRTIEPASMRSQMHRLKTDSVLKHDPEKDIWDFQLGKRALYDTYNHQSSRKAMPELRDNDPDDDDALLRAAEKLAWTPADDEAAQKSETTNPKPKAPPVRIGPLVIKRRV
jgi:hypothetical protein